MNVHDHMYEGRTDSAMPFADTALLETVDRACLALNCKMPNRVLASSVTTRSGKQFLQIDLVDLTEYPWPTWRAYAERSDGIVSALQNLALYGCRGDELAFLCFQALDKRYRRWVLVDPVTMLEKSVNGRSVRSDDYIFIPAI